MVSRHSGHFVQVFKPVAANNWYMSRPRGNEVPRSHPNYVRVEGRTTSRTVTANPGWFNMSRELSRKDAVKYAKAYRRAGFHSRVLFRGNDGKTRITDEFVV